MSGIRTNRGEPVQLVEATLDHARGGAIGDLSDLAQQDLQLSPKGTRPKPGGPTRYIGETEKNLG